MNRSIPSLIALIPIVVILGLFMFFFQVRESEVAVVRTFGKIADKTLPFRFELDAALKDELKAGDVSQVLRDAFEAREIKLDERSQVRQDTQTQNWYVEDRKHSFRVKTEPDEEGGNAKLRIYEEVSDSVIRTPGFFFRWPWPIQSIDTFDNRLQITTTTGEETPTGDGKPIIITTAIGWRIADPYWFSIRCNDMETARERLKSRVRSDQKTVIGNYDFAHFVSIDPEELKYDEIENGIAVEVAGNARKLYGIEVEYVRLEKLALPRQITKQVFDAMKKERQAEATRIESEGESQATWIKGQAESIADTILGFANRTAKEIEAKGIEQAAAYNKTFRQDESLALFLLNIENLPKILKERTTLVFDQNSPLVSMLKGMTGAQVPATAPANNAIAPGDETPILDVKK